jgi:hypothetical protein
MVVFSLGFLNAAQNDEAPTARFLIGVGFTYTFISVFADLGAGDFAAGFAILILISAVLYEGEDIMALLTKRAGKSKQKKRRKRGGTEGLEGAEGMEGFNSNLQKMGRIQRAQRLMRPNRR